MRQRAKIVLFSRYDRLGASSRLRSLQYLPLLNKEFDIEVRPLFDNEYLHQLYAGNSPSKGYILNRYFQRFFQLMALRKYDIIWIEYELFPYLPAWAESLLAKANKPYIVDYDDAIFHRYDLTNNPIKKMLAKKIDNVMYHATLVTAGNNYLADRARKAGANWVERIPTVIDIDRYPIKQITANERYIIGWIGSPTTAKYLHQIIPAIKQLLGKYNVSLRIIGAEIEVSDINITCIPWSEESEVSEIQKFDIGIMPLTDSLWEKGKCGYKLIQYMACGIPVIASPVGVNREIVEKANSGLLANTDEEWQLSFEQLLSNLTLRQELGKNGRKAVEDYYSIQVIAPKLSKLLHKASGNV